MKLSVAHTFHPDLVPRLAEIPQVREVYGKLDRDIVGGGRSTYTLRHTGKRAVERAIAQAHRHNIEFNYLINGASLGGNEQTRTGQRKIRRLLDWICAAGADAVTVASPFLARIVKRNCPQLHIRTSAFAMVDTAQKARQWEDIGVDTICVSAISCNRDFARLRSLREAVSCELQLIANASCLLNCAYEPTHMQLLTQSSRRGESAFCLDYCVLNCSRERLKDPINYIRACWIRPEDLGVYEKLGYSYFKILERSCPLELLVKRVKAYAARSFDGNLYELVAPMASITKKLDAPLLGRARMILSMAKPHKIKVSSLLDIHKYMTTVIPDDFSRDTGPVYIDNRALDGFVEQAKRHHCGSENCDACGICRRYAETAVAVGRRYRESARVLAERLALGAEEGSLW